MPLSARVLCPLVLLAAVAGVVAACGDQGTEPARMGPVSPTAGISDGAHDPEGNPRFHWLAPLVSQPPAAALGTFMEGLGPRVDVVCWSAPGGECTPGETVLSYDRTSGLEEEEGHYQVDVPTAQLVASSPGSTVVYRVVVWTDPLTELGGPFELGHLSLALGANGRAVRGLETDDRVAAVHGRTLPVRFRIDRGAYEHALATNEATVPGDPDGSVCQENCSVAVVSPTEQTEATLTDEGTGEEVTGVLFEPGDVQTTTILVIDAVETTGEPGTCATGIQVEKTQCFRYKVFPDDPFANDVRVGVCPYGVDISETSNYELLKADLDALTGEWLLTKPTPVDVSDFLPCPGLQASGDGLGGMVRLAMDWLVSPLYADDDDDTKVWGGMVRDFSDIFWGVDAEMSAASPTTGVAPVNDTVTPTVQVNATAPDPDEGLASAPVTFTLVEGSGLLILPAGLTFVDSTGNSLTVETDATGLAWVELKMTSAQAVVDVTSDVARGGPIRFEYTDPESLVLSSWERWFAVNGYSGGPGMLLSATSFQHSAPWLNRGMKAYSDIPRISTVNDADVAASGQYYWPHATAWDQLFDAIDAARVGLRAILVDQLVSLPAADAARAEAFGKFVLGISYGTLAMLYDQAPIMDENTTPGVTPMFSSYGALKSAALSYLDEAIAVAQGATFVVPDTFIWVDPSGLDQGELIQVAQSYKARIRAATARTPTERAAVDWSQVITEIDDGITTDFEYHYDDTLDRYHLALFYSLNNVWSQMGYFVHGMADTAGHYQTWMSTPLADRQPYLAPGYTVPFLLETPDTRFPQGDSLSAQLQAPGSRFVAMDGNQQGAHWQRPERGTWRWSFYRDARDAWSVAVTGSSPDLSMHEMNLLKAEALLRIGDDDGAAALINQTRTAAGLAPTDDTGTNPDCVPRLPDGSCGDLWEMLKWEKRLMAGHNSGMMAAGWYFDSRGWGDLHEGTILNFPVPEHIAVQYGLPVLEFGGGLQWSAPVGTYGY